MYMQNIRQIHWRVIELQVNTAHGAWRTAQGVVRNYPKEWMNSIITPINKFGDINNPQNYKGIAVCDSMNKVLRKS